MAEACLKFLIVDGHADSRFLLAKTLQRKFPGAWVQECQTGDLAVAFLSQERPDVIVVHRTDDMDGATLIRKLRDLDAVVPVVMVSGIDRREAAKASGATFFLHYDEWLRIGSVVTDLLQGAAGARPP